MKEYLVIQLARFGDLIQTKRLLTTLCARENGVVHLCVDVSLKQLAELVYPDVKVHSIVAHGTGLKGVDALRAMLLDNRSTFASLQSIGFDEIYNLNFSPLNFRMAALFDPDSVHGYAWSNGQELTGLWPQMAMRWSDYRRLGMNLVDFWAGYCPDMVRPDQVNPVATGKGGGLGVVLAGRESRRSLPADSLTRIVATLAASRKAKEVKLLGGGSEYAAGQALIKQLPPAMQDKTVNLAGKTGWTDLVDVVGSLDMLLTPDTGTMHLAAHLGTPVTAFFLSSAWCFETGPYGLGHTVYQANTSCLPCLESQPCPFDVKCLNCFNVPEFLRFAVTHKSDHVPDHLIAYESGFDELGQIYIPFAGLDPDAEQRPKYRNFMTSHLLGTGGGISEIDVTFAQRIYRERDWITQTISGATIGN